MNDLRERANYPLEPSVIETHAVTDDYGRQLYTVTTVMPDLRSAEARTRDAHARGLDTRTFDQQVTAELVRIVDALQVLRLEVDELKRTQAVTIAGLEAYIRDHSEADDVPFAMAEDAWGQA